MSKATNNAVDLVMNSDVMNNHFDNIKRMTHALEAARLLCANLAHGGQGHMTLVNNFLTLDAEIK